jgi:transcriptional repressor NF-X1
MDDHVPYSDTTLKFFKENATWAQTHEREFRVFAGDSQERRLRFKPMQPQQRAFLHSLAEDYGLDSESQDPEPHRHVCLFKTPRFVSAPKKTLAQCVKIRSTQAAAELVSSRAAAAVAARASEPFNAFLLSSPRFGLTVEEVESALAADLATYPNISFTTSFLPSEEIVVKASTSGTWGAPTASALETSLSTLKGAISRTVSKHSLATSVILCHADSSLNILRREGGGTRAGGPGAGAAGAGGWSAVVSRAAKKSAQPGSSAEKPEEKRVASGFVGLKKKKAEEEAIADDWEAAAELLED